VNEISEELDQHVQAGETEVTDSETNLTDTTVNLDNSNLSMEQKERLNELISQNMDAFAVSMHNLGKTELHYHRIDTGNARPVAQRFYRTSPKMRKEMENHIKELLENGLIEPPPSEWRSPVVMLKKPGDAGYSLQLTTGR
jgi:hypothetical protein